MKNSTRKRYFFIISVLDSYSDKKVIDVKNLSKAEAKIVFEELCLKFGD